MTAFIKMHGLGNDFIVLDARELANRIPDVISKAAATALADRRFGIGCDQILVIRPSHRADIFLQIHSFYMNRLHFMHLTAKRLDSESFSRKERQLTIKQTFISVGFFLFVLANFLSFSPICFG